MYIKTNSNNHGSNVYCSFEGTAIFQISNITFYYKRFSARSDEPMGPFRIQLHVDNKTWCTRYNIRKKGRFSNSSTQWTLTIENFTVEVYGIKVILIQIDSLLGDRCF